MSSRLLEMTPVENKWFNLLVQEGIKRAPINIRPIFLVERRRNYKGAALFAMANLDMYELTGNGLYEREARDLVDWLIEESLDGYSGFSGGGHRHRLQRLDRENPSGGAAGVVAASYAVKALLRFSRAFDDEEYANIARTSADFVLGDLDYEEVHEGARIAYGSWETGVYTLNANALGARLLVDLYDRFGEARWLDAARKLLDYVVSKQTALGGWMYRDPPTASHLSMDNHHNGFIVESLCRYQQVADSDRYESAVDRALRFHRDRLFDDDGAPNWDESSTFPRDVHAAAQGILVFTYAGDLPFARRIAEWTLDELYAGNGRFYYQKRRYYTKRFTLMRWCQAWMAYALGEYLLEASRPST